jgi:hypothetical protein
MDLNKIWVTVFSLMKKITGDVDVEGKGSLQEQIISGDSKDNIVNFVSNDNTQVSKWTDVEALESGETHRSIFNKISTMFANIRYIYNNVGNIKGIVETLDDCTATTVEGYAASALALSQLNSKLLYKTYTSNDVTVPAGVNKPSSTIVNIPITDVSHNDYDIVGITVSTGDAAILAAPINIANNYTNASRVVLALINQYIKDVTCTVAVIVCFKRKD